MNTIIEHLRNGLGIARNVISNFQFKDILDIFVIGLLIYGCVKLVRETRAGQLLKGLGLLAVAYVLSVQFKMVMVSALLSQFVTFAVVALVILFQPEIRKALEQMGRNNMKRTFIGLFSEKSSDDIAAEEAIDQVAEAAEILQQLKMGALVVFERQTKLNEIVETGTVINADITARLMGNIFYNKAPLHDGAMIIRDGRILAAGCILPLTNRTNVHANLGTRHRAALGISEDSDAVAVAVSEETGQISVAVNGVLNRNFSRTTLKETLSELLTDQSDTGEKGETLLRRFGFGKRKGR